MRGTLPGLGLSGLQSDAHFFLPPRGAYVYNPSGIQFDDECRFLYSPPDNSYIDWMHTVAASGGIAQIEIYNFCAKVKLRIFPLKDALLYNGFLVTRFCQSAVRF
jgi:hypothetical protein